MNCEKREQQILLAQSGELSPAAARELDEHIAGCPRCREYRDSLADVLTVSGKALRSGVPSDQSLHRIKVAALNREERGLVTFSRPFAVALAAAAALVIAVGVWKLTPGGDPAPATSDLDAIIMMVQYEDEEETALPAAGRQKSIRELADELLSMEGFAVDEWTDDEWLTSDEEPPATGLRSRSNPDSQARICV